MIRFSSINRKFPPACLGLALLLSGQTRCVGKTPTPKPQDLIEAAHKISGLDAFTPYTLTADVTLIGDSRKGSLVIYRDGDKERVELKLGEYLEKQISLGTKSYIEPKHALLDAGGFATFDRSWDPRPPSISTAATPAPSFGKVSSKNFNGQSAWCFDEHSKYLKTTLCFDAQRSIMLEKGRKKNLYEFLDFAQFGNQLIPQTVKITNERLPDITLNNIRLSQRQLSPELWVPAEDSVEIRTCDRMKPPKAEFTPEPSFPSKARAAHKTGMVTLYTIINSAGKAIMPQSLNDDPYGFTDAGKEIVKQWRFRPGTCGGIPTNVQMTLELQFNYAP